MGTATLRSHTTCTAASAQRAAAYHSLGVIRNEIDGVVVSIIIVLVCRVQFGVAEVGQGDEFH